MNFNIIKTSVCTYNSRQQILYSFECIHVSMCYAFLIREKISFALVGKKVSRPGGEKAESR